MKKILSNIYTKSTKIEDWRFKLFTRISFIRMWGDWYYLVSVASDVYA